MARKKATKRTKRPKPTNNQPAERTWANLDRNEKDKTIEKYAIANILMRRRLEMGSLEFQGDKIHVHNTIDKKDLEPELSDEIEKLRKFNP